MLRTPFLRWLLVWGAHGDNIGVCADGIAGIFVSADQDVERVMLRSRRGLARLALRKGLSILPCYSFGNTSCFVADDVCGVLAAVSRKLRTSIFWPRGRFGLPLPRRSRITLVFGTPISVRHVPAPTEEDITVLHDK
eukprot:gene46581-43366_t